MPDKPFVIIGTIKNSDGIAVDGNRIIFMTSVGNQVVMANSNGTYSFDLANIGYTAGETASWTSRDKFNNEIQTGTFVVGTGGTTINVSLTCRLTRDIQKSNRDNMLFAVGGEPIMQCNPLWVRQVTQDNRGLQMDKSTRVQTTMTYEHHEIHAGSHYFIADYVALGNGASIDLTLQTPDTAKWAHMIFAAVGTQAIIVEIFEDATYAADGTLAAPPNSNRNSSKTSTLILRTNPTVSDDGTAIFRQRVGANKIGGKVGREQEIILKQNTKYIFRITNALTTETTVSWIGEWYEHQDKE